MKRITIVGACLIVVLAAAASLPAAPPEKPAPPPATKRMPRMYPGAPPVVPHDVEERRSLCLDCHTTGTDGAPFTPHPTRTHFCVQCHVEQDATVKPFSSPKLVEPAKRK